MYAKHNESMPLSSASSTSRDWSVSIVGNGFWALLSGTFGAAASCFAKLAFRPPSSTMITATTTTTTIAQESCPALFPKNNLAVFFQQVFLFTWISCYWTFILGRLLSLIAMILCNVAMVSCFVGGLQDAGSIAGTALATAANFLVSVAAGYMLWNEGGGGSGAGAGASTGEDNHIDWSHLLGIGMVVAGTVLLLLAQRPDDEKPQQSTSSSSSPSSQTLRANDTVEKKTQ